jgi:tetratricopeptide (TPR) repeat protein
VLAVALVFGQTYRHELLAWDDTLHVTQNPNVNPPSWAGLANTWRKPYFNLYVPVTYSFFAAEAWLAQPGSAAPALATPAGAAPAPVALDARVFHIGNVCLHAANVLLVFALLVRLIGHRGGAFFGALLFALHPVQVESVAWVSETRGLLAGFFSLLSAWCYFQVVADTKVATPILWRRQALWYAAATIGFALALLSKPSAVALPVVFFLLHGLLINRSQQPSSRRWLAAAMWLAPWLLMAGAMTLVNKSQQSGDVIRFAPPPGARLLIAGDALTFYLAKLLIPWPLAAAYGHSARQVLADPLLWPKALAPLALPFALVWLRPRPIWLAGAGVFLAALLPVLGIVPFAYEDISTVADRYLYLALLGPALIVAHFAAAKWSQRTRVIGAGFGLLFALLSVWQAAAWHDEETLFAQCVWASPRSYVAHNKLGLVELARGDARSAAAHFEQARDIDPTYAVTYNNLASAYRSLQRFDEAIAQYRVALELDPTSSIASFNLGNIYLKDLNRLSEARQCYTESIRLNPHYAPAQLNLGVVLLRQGDSAAALAPIEAALRLSPADAEVLFTLGHALWQLGRREEALARFTEAVRLSPTEPRYLTAWHKYQREMATGPSPP